MGARRVFFWAALAALDCVVCSAQPPAQGMLFREPVRVLIANRDPSRRLNAVADQILEISGAGGQTVRVQFDSLTPSREFYQDEAGSMEETLADWRASGSLKMPFKWTLSLNGRPVSESTVLDYRFNTGLNLDELSRKP